MRPLALLDAVPLPTAAADRSAWATLVRDAAGTVLGVPLVPRRRGTGRGAPGRCRRRGGRRPARGCCAARPRRRSRCCGCTHVTATGERGLRPEVDQTHESVVVGPDHAASDCVVVKWSVHVEPAPATAARRGRGAAPRRCRVPRGARSRSASSSTTTVDRQVLLASVTRFLPGAVDGWDWYVDDLLAWLDGGLSDTAMSEPAAALGALVGRHARRVRDRVGAVPDAGDAGEPRTTSRAGDVARSAPSTRPRP